MESTVDSDCNVNEFWSLPVLQWQTRRRWWPPSWPQTHGQWESLRRSRGWHWAKSTRNRSPWRCSPRCPGPWSSCPEGRQGCHSRSSSLEIVKMFTEDIYSKTSLLVYNNGRRARDRRVYFIISVICQVYNM